MSDVKRLPAFLSDATGADLSTRFGRTRRVRILSHATPSTVTVVVAPTPPSASFTVSKWEQYGCRTGDVRLSSRAHLLRRLRAVAKASTPDAPRRTPL